MSDEKMRVEFEAWVSSQGFGSTWQKKRNMYSDFTTHFAWEAWQASRAAMQGEPDVAGLVEALERISKRASEAECRQAPCSPIQRLLVDIMQQADDALATHHKGAES